MESKRSQTVVAAVAVAVMVGGSWAYMRSQGGDEAESEGAGPAAVVPSAQSANTGLEIDEGSGHGRPFVWVRERSTGRQATVPRAELAGATIRFADCDLAAIGPALLYPSRTDIVCLELHNDRHTLSAYVYGTHDDLERQVDFFERNVEPSRREPLGGGRHQNGVEVTRRDPATRAFIVMYQIDAGGGFVGYRERAATAR